MIRGHGYYVYYCFDLVAFAVDGCVKSCEADLWFADLGFTLIWPFVVDWMLNINNQLINPDVTVQTCRMNLIQHAPVCVAGSAWTWASTPPLSASRRPWNSCQHSLLLIAEISLIHLVTRKLDNMVSDVPDHQRPWQHEVQTHRADTVVM